MTPASDTQTPINTIREASNVGKAGNPERQIWKNWHGERATIFPVLDMVAVAVKLAGNTVTFRRINEDDIKKSVEDCGWNNLNSHIDIESDKFTKYEVNCGVNHHKLATPAKDAKL